MRIYWSKIRVEKSIAIYFLVTGICLLHSQNPIISATIDPELEAYWRRPIPPQGQVPGNYSKLEGSLYPEDCGACHVDKYKNWKKSRHAMATGPGIHVQILEMQERGEKLEKCGKCHFPMTEQHQDLFQTKNRFYDQNLYQKGVFCSVCHVRNQVRHGPPRRGKAQLNPPHDGFNPKIFFQKSEFCGSCHQFGPGDLKINGKYVEDTVNEWKASNAFKKGVQCQGCHMPNREHLWLGIHDKKTTLGGLKIKLNLDSSQAKATLFINTSGIGHKFPTYATPAVWVKFEFRDSKNKVFKKSYRVGWNLPINLGNEIEDTRLRPDREYPFEFKWNAGKSQGKLKVEIVVDPDEFYRRFYQSKLKISKNPSHLKLYKMALKDVERNVYVLWRESKFLDN